MKKHEKRNIAIGIVGLIILGLIIFFAITAFNAKNRSSELSYHQLFKCRTDQGVNRDEGVCVSPVSGEANLFSSSTPKLKFNLVDVPLLQEPLGESATSTFKKNLVSFLRHNTQTNLAKTYIVRTDPNFIFLLQYGAGPASPVKFIYIGRDDGVIKTLVAKKFKQYYNDMVFINDRYVATLEFPTGTFRLIKSSILPRSETYNPDPGSMPDIGESLRDVVYERFEVSVPIYSVQPRTYGKYLRSATSSIVSGAMGLDSYSPGKLGIQEPTNPVVLKEGGLILGTNTWKGYIGGIYTVITGTAKKDDPAQGALYMWQPGEGIGSNETYLSPTKTGPLKIISERGGILTVKSVAGKYEVYDIKTDTHKYVTTKGGNTYTFDLKSRKFR